MKKIVAILLIFAPVMMVGNIAYAYTIDDDTLVGKGYSWTDTSPSPIPSVDVIGDPDYQSYGIDISFTSDGNLSVSFYTNFDGFDFGFIGLADLALDLNLDGYYEYGIDLSSVIDTNGNFTGDVRTSGVWSVDQNGWETSHDYIENPNPANTSFYYGEYMISNDNYTHSIVNIDEANSDNSLLSASINVSLSKSNGGVSEEYDYVYQLVVEDYASILNFGDEFGVFWGTAVCGNDVIEGTASAPVPEPATMLLFGSGLIGLGSVGRKKLKRR